MWIPDRLPEDVEALVRALAHLPRDVRITITVPAGVLVRALTDSVGGPEIMGTSQAARFLGYQPKTWREWAAARPDRGRLAGAGRRVVAPTEARLRSAAPG